MTIFERVKNALDTLAPVPNAMGRMMVASGDLPDTFLVYNLVSSTPALHFDDREAGREYVIQVSIYNRSGLVGLPDVTGAMITAGFTQGNWRLLPIDPQSGHYGMAKDYNYYEEGA